MNSLIPNEILSTGSTLPHWEESSFPPYDISERHPLEASDDLKEAQITMQLHQALMKLHQENQPFAWDNRHTLALPLPLTKQSSTINASLKAYYNTLAEEFMTAPIDLPTPFLQGSQYRRFCFHAWIGEALIKSLADSAEEPLS